MTTELMDLHREWCTTCNAIVGYPSKPWWARVVVCLYVFPVSSHIYIIDIRSTTAEKHSCWCFVSSGLYSSLEMRFTCLVSKAHLGAEQHIWRTNPTSCSQIKSSRLEELRKKMAEICFNFKMWFRNKRKTLNQSVLSSARNCQPPRKKQKITLQPDNDRGSGQISGIMLNIAPTPRCVFWLTPGADISLVPPNVSGIITLNSFFAL